MTRPRAWLQPSTCRRCAAPTLVADRDHLWDVRVDAELDPVTLDCGGQVACVVAGRPTWVAWHEAGRWLTGRWHPVGPTIADAVVLPAHECGRPLPGTPFTVDTSAAVYAEPCPF